MSFRAWFENDQMSYSNKPLISYLSPALAMKIKNFHLPDWQTNVEFLKRLKYVVDNEGDEHIQMNQPAFEKTVVKIAMDVGHAQLQARMKQEIDDEYDKLETKKDDYERCWSGDKFERIVCGKNAGFEKTGMPAYDVSSILNDPELKGYFGIHVGDADSWLDWLVDDGYYDGDIYVYEITTPDDVPFYKVEDQNSGGWAGDDASEQVPDGEIIFSKLNVIPAQYIRVSRFIKEKDYWKEQKRNERRRY